MKKPTPSATERKMIEKYIRSFALNNEAQQIADILMLVDNPFIDRTDNDLISLIFHRFYKHTDIHAALPLFTYFSYLSAWCVINNVNYKVPLTSKSYELDTWVCLLAESGASKSLSESILSSSLPTNPETNERIIKSDIAMPASNASLVTQIAELKNNRGYWKQDEASQFMKQVDQNTGPLASIKQTLLLVKDHSNLTYATKSDGKTTIEKPVLTVLFINTIKAMKAAFSEESMIDGTFRRFTIAMAKKSENYYGAKEFSDTALYCLDEINDEILNNAMIEVFSQNIEDTSFTFTNACTKLYKQTWKIFWEKQYIKFLSENEAYFRTYMMEAWKYAIFHHLTHKKSGTIVDEYSLQWGLKVSMYLLNSLQEFIKSNVTKPDVDNETSRIKSIMGFIKENEDKQGFGIRSLCRKFHLKKDEVMS
ncbi:MAG TPA: hypothetical protein DDY18_10745, partial [Flavobacterium sp.]|nr:hypothetical protein [Flavobacterium sp.]